MLSVPQLTTVVQDGICEHVVEHPQLAPLAKLLIEREYPLGERREILAHALAFGTVAGGIVREDLLRPADAIEAERALAQGAFDAASEPKPCKCHADRPDVATGRAIVRAIRHAASPLAVPRALMPPVSGVPAYEPCAADWREFEQWLAAIDFPRVKDATDKARDMADVAVWYQQNPEG